MKQETVVKDNIKKFYNSDLDRIKREVEDILNFYNEYEFVDTSELLEVKNLLER